MPAPALIGLGALWGALSSSFASFVGLLFTQTAKRIAVITLVIAGIYTAVSILFNLMSTYATPLLQSLPPQLATIGYFLPSNTIACISAVIAVELGCIAYSLTIKALEIQTKVV